MAQKLKPKPKPKRKKREKLEFDAGKVFTTSEAKKEDLELDLESARYKARKGEGGNRRSGPPGNADGGSYPSVSEALSKIWQAMSERAQKSFKKGVV